MKEPHYAALSPAPTWLFVIPWFLRERGGVDQVVLNLYRECVRGGRYRPLVLALDWHAPTPLFEEVVGCRVVRFRIRPLSGSAVGLLKWFVMLPVELRRLHQLLRNERVAVLNVHYPTLSVVGPALLRWFGVFRGRIVLSFHGTDLAEVAASTGLSRIAWRWVQEIVDCATACSEHLAGRVRHFFQGHDTKVHVLLNGIDLAHAAAEVQGARWSHTNATRRYFLNVGAYLHIKGQDVLVQAFARLATDILDVDLVIIGRDCGAKPDLERLVATLGIAHRVQLLPAVPHAEVLAALRDAVAFVMPSRYEGFGIALLEAGAFATPVVAASVGGIPEIIPSERFGWLVGSDDVLALETALRRVVSEPERAAATGRALRERIAQEFTWRRAYEQMVGFAET